jgi:small multidrug resistance pump
MQDDERFTMGWFYLFLSIICEAIGICFLKLTNGFTVLLPSVGTLVAHLFCFYFGSLALKTIDISVSYAVGSACGIVLMTLIGYFYFHENFSALKIVFITLILIGTVGLRLIER